MPVQRIASRLLFVTGATLLALAILLLLSARLGAGDGWSDLAAVAGALLAAMASGAAFGLHLLLARRKRTDPAWMRGTALAGALVGVLAALQIGRVALEAPNLPLLAVVGLVLAAALAGLAAGAAPRRPSPS